MNADQIKAIVADKNATAVCSTVTGAGGVGKIVVVNLDRGVIGNGTVQVDPDCHINMNNTAVVRPQQNVYCSPLSYERSAAGVCTAVKRESNCLLISSTPVAATFCPTS